MRTNHGTTLKRCDSASPLSPSQVAVGTSRWDWLFGFDSRREEKISKKVLTNRSTYAIIKPSNEGGRKTMMTTVKTMLDGTIPVKPLSYVLGDDWTYLYSDSWKGVEFDVHACMNGEVVAVVEG